MSVQPPAAPHRVSMADVDIPFGRMVVLIIKWTLAAIPAMIILSILFAIVGALLGGIIAAMFGLPSLKV
jgi:hypothetical protein